MNFKTQLTQRKHQKQLVISLKNDLLSLKIEEIYLRYSMINLDEIRALLKTQKLRVTNSRMAVATILLKNIGKPLTSEEIFNKIQRSKKYDCDQVSVYRILSTYEQIGLIKKSVLFYRYLFLDKRR